MQVDLTDVCHIDVIAGELLLCGASIGLKLRRAGALCGYTDEEIVMAGVGRCRSTCTARVAPRNFADAESRVAELSVDSPDCVLLWALSATGGAFEKASEVMDKLCWAVVARNFLVSCELLLDRRADINAIQTRRGRHRGLVDVAAHTASNDGDWRLVKLLLQRGAKPVAPQGVLFTPLRQSNTELARELFKLGVHVGQDGLAGLLCDACSHGATGTVGLLIDEMNVPVHAVNARDHTNATDRAIAWHRWDTAEWLVTKRGGSPSKVGSALSHLLDASSDSRVLRIMQVLFCNGDLALCEWWLSAFQSSTSRSCLTEDMCPSFVDLALCQGHLRLALTLLRRGARSKDRTQAKTDLLLHGSAKHELAAEILSFLGENFPSSMQKLYFHRSSIACGTDCVRAGAPQSFPIVASQCEAPAVLCDLR